VALVIVAEMVVDNEGILVELWSLFAIRNYVLKILSSMSTLSTS